MNTNNQINLHNVLLSVNNSKYATTKVRNVADYSYAELGEIVARAIGTSDFLADITITINPVITTDVNTFLDLSNDDTIYNDTLDI